MAQRVYIGPQLIRVSRPGVDAASAAEKDLLLSLGARNMQLIQRGYVTAPSPQNVSVAQEVGDFYFSVGFPGQSSVPDFWCGFITVTATPQDRMNYNENYKPTYVPTLSSSRADVKVTASTNANVGLKGMIYVVLRKRLDS